MDSVLFPLFLNRELEGYKNFTLINPAEYQLSTEGKRKVVAAIYQRLNQKILWDGSKRETKKCIEYQVRALAQYFLGKRAFYMPFSYEAVRL